MYCSQTNFSKLTQTFKLLKTKSGSKIHAVVKEELLDDIATYR